MALRSTFDKICRICMKIEPDMFSLFDNNDSISDKIMLCTEIKIDRAEDLPVKICKKCSDDLEIAYNFKRLSEKSDKILRLCLETTETNHLDEIIYSDDGLHMKVQTDESDDSEIEQQRNKRLSTDKKHKQDYLTNKIDNNTGLKVQITHEKYSAMQSPQKANKPKENNTKMNEEESEIDILAKVMQEGFNAYPCELCGKTFDTRQSLRSHTKRHVDSRPFQCELCQRAFRERATLKVHMRIHTGEKPFTCDYCPKTFGQNSSKKSHMIRQHSKETPYQCDMCGKLFKVLRSYTHHLAGHKNERNHVCGICGARFNLSGSLKAHSVVHTGQRSHVCEICNKAFWRPENLNQHKRIHSDVTPFECQICSKSFRFKAVLRSHLKSKHDIIECQS